MENIEFIRTVAKDIIGIKIEYDDSINTMRKKFFRVTRKYGIKQGTKDGKGVLRNNFEWTMCWNLFINVVIEFKIDWSDLLENTPKDLRHY